MIVDLQLKINSDPNQKRFIRQYPNWYKLLNRNPLLYKDFVNDMKDKYKLKPSDKLNQTLNNISLIQAFLEVLK